LRKIWVTSDTHFSHKNMLKFTKEDGSLVRPEFRDVHHMNDEIITRWNETVGDDDIIYHLGDIGFNQSDLATILPCLKGHKRLLLGNHDNFDMSFYSDHFEKIGVVRQFGKVLLSHYPVHIDPNDHHSYELNIHGHIHHQPAPTKKHVNVSVEKTDYTPVLLDRLVAKCKRFKK